MKKNGKPYTLVHKEPLISFSKKWAEDYVDSDGEYIQPITIIWK